MSKVEALKASITDKKIVDLMEENDRLLGLELTEMNKTRTSEYKSIKDKMTAMEETIAKLETKIEALEGAGQDDKYKITKVKLIQLMKDLGYYN